MTHRTVFLSLAFTALVLWCFPDVVSCQSDQQKPAGLGSVRGAYGTFHHRYVHNPVYASGINHAADQKRKASPERSTSTQVQELAVNFECAASASASISNSLSATTWSTLAPQAHAIHVSAQEHAAVWELSTATCGWLWLSGLWSCSDAHTCSTGAWEGVLQSASGEMVVAVGVWDAVEPELGNLALSSACTAHRPVLVDVQHMRVIQSYGRLSAPAGFSVSLPVQGESEGKLRVDVSGLSTIELPLTGSALSVTSGAVLLGGMWHAGQASPLASRSVSAGYTGRELLASTCAAGTYQRAPMMYCADCDAGYHSIAGESSCSACGIGQISNMTGATDCYACPGTSIPNVQRSACASCPDGYYASNDNCVACPVDSQPNSSGACVACPPGQVSAGGEVCHACKDWETVVTSSEGSSCMPCGIGYRKDPQSGCVLCPASTYRLEGTNDCSEICPVGFTWNSSELSCAACGADQVWSAGLCDSCGPGKFLASATKCLACGTVMTASTYGCSYSPNVYVALECDNDCVPFLMRSIEIDGGVQYFDNFDSPEYNTGIIHRRIRSESGDPVEFNFTWHTANYFNLTVYLGPNLTLHEHDAALDCAGSAIFSNYPDQGIFTAMSTASSSHHPDIPCSIWMQVRPMAITGPVGADLQVEVTGVHPANAELVFNSFYHIEWEPVVEDAQVVFPASDVVLGTAFELKVNFTFFPVGSADALQFSITGAEEASPTLAFVGEYQPDWGTSDLRYSCLSEPANPLSCALSNTPESQISRILKFNVLIPRAAVPAHSLHRLAIQLGAAPSGVVVPLPLSWARPTAVLSETWDAPYDTTNDGVTQVWAGAMATMTAVFTVAPGQVLWRPQLDIRGAWVQAEKQCKLTSQGVMFTGSNLVASNITSPGLKNHHVIWVDGTFIANETFNGTVTLRCVMSISLFAEQGDAVMVWGAGMDDVHDRSTLYLAAREVQLSIRAKPSLRLIPQVVAFTTPTKSNWSLIAQVDLGFAGVSMLPVYLVSASSTRQTTRSFDFNGMDVPNPGSLSDPVVPGSSDDAARPPPGQGSARALRYPTGGETTTMSAGNSDSTLGVPAKQALLYHGDMVQFNYSHATTPAFGVLNMTGIARSLNVAVVNTGLRVTVQGSIEYCPAWDNPTVITGTWNFEDVRTSESFVYHQQLAIAVPYGRGAMTVMSDGVNVSEATTTFAHHVDCTGFDAETVSSAKIYVNVTAPAGGCVVKIPVNFQGLAIVTLHTAGCTDTVFTWAPPSPSPSPTATAMMSPSHSPTAASTPASSFSATPPPLPSKSPVALLTPTPMAKATASATAQATTTPSTSPQPVPSDIVLRLGSDQTPGDGASSTTYNLHIAAAGVPDTATSNALQVPGSVAWDTRQRVCGELKPVLSHGLTPSAMSSARMPRLLTSPGSAQAVAVSALHHPAGACVELKADTEPGTAASSETFSASWPPFGSVQPSTGQVGTNTSSGVALHGWWGAGVAGGYEQYSVLSSQLQISLPSRAFSVDVQVVGSVWPWLDDVILPGVPGAAYAGTLPRSGSSGSGGSAVILSGINDTRVAACAAHGLGSECGWSLLADLHQHIPALRARNRAEPSIQRVSVSSGGGGGSSGQLNGVIQASSLVILRARAGAGGAFLPGLRAWLGTTEMEVLGVSVEGTWAIVRVPEWSALCGVTGCKGPTGYKPIWLWNAAAVQRSAWRAQAHAMSACVSAAGQASCASQPAWYTPRTVPGSTTARQLSSSTVWNLTLPSSMPSVTPGDDVLLGGASVCPHACPATGSDSAMTVLPDSALVPGSTPAYGMYMTATCAGYDLPGPNCMAESSHCAWGAGDDCTACSAGEICPGGYRRWARAGWFVANEFSPVPAIRCAAPAAQRCAGQDASSGAMQCGEGYAQGVWGCASCATGYYAELDGSCSACPQHNSPLQAALLPLLWIAIGAAAVFALTTAGVRAARAKRGETWVGAAMLSAQFVIWAVSVLQLQAQVGRSAGPGLPAYLREVYTLLAVLQLDMAPVVHPACLSSSPFIFETVQLSLILLMVLATFVLMWDRTWTWIVSACSRVRGLCVRHGSAAAAAAAAAGGGSVWRWRVLWVTLAGSTMLYPLAVNAGLRMIWCVPVSQTDVYTDQSTGEIHTETHEVWVLNTAPGVQCFAGAHTGAGVLGSLVLCAHGIAFPLLLLVWLNTFLGSHWTQFNVKGYGCGFGWRQEGGRLSAMMRVSSKGRRGSVHIRKALKSARKGADEAVNQDLRVIENPALMLLVEKPYQSAYLAWHSIDMGLFGALAVLTVAWPVGADAGSGAVAQLVCTVLLLLALGVALTLQAPFRRDHAWKRVVRLFSVFVSLAGAVLNYVIARHHSDAELSSAVQGLSVFVALAGTSLVLMLCVAFWYTILRTKTQKQLVAEAVQPHKQLVQTSSSSAGSRGSAEQQQQQSGHPEEGRSGPGNAGDEHVMVSPMARVPVGSPSHTGSSMATNPLSAWTSKMQLYGVGSSALKPLSTARVPIDPNARVAVQQPGRASRLMFQPQQSSARRGRERQFNRTNKRASMAKAAL